MTGSDFTSTDLTVYSVVHEILEVSPRILSVSSPPGSGNSQGDLDKETLTNRCVVLRKYVDDDLGRQKQTLYALQHLMHRLEHPNSE